MRVVNVKELKSRLSSYLRAAHTGEVFAVTDRGQVVARLGPADFAEVNEGKLNPLAQLVKLGVRLPLRRRRASDYRRTGRPIGLTASQIDALLDEARDDSR